MPALGEASIRSAWAGLRPLTPDEHGIIDQMPGLDNILAAVGFCGHGFQHSPAIGMSVAELIVDGQTSIDITPLGLDRFSKGVKPMSDVPRTGLMVSRDLPRVGCCCGAPSPGGLGWGEGSSPADAEEPTCTQPLQGERELLRRFGF